MKTSKVILALTLVILLVSCEKGNETARVPESGVYRKFLNVNEFYDQSGAIQYGDYNLVIVDSVDHSIYMVMDTVDESYTSFHYDNDGKLVKIVGYYTDNAGIVSRDSLMVTRPSANSIKWTYSAGSGVPALTMTTTDLGSSRKLITITEEGSDPAVFYDKMYMNTHGSMDSLIRTVPGNGGVGVSRLKRELFYSANHAPVSQVVTTSLSTSTMSTVSTSTITRDLHENGYLHTFLDDLYGTDMTWLSYNDNRSFILFLDAHFTDRIALLNGTVLTLSTLGKQYDNGVYVADAGSADFQFIPQYDVQGRMTTFDLKDNTFTSYLQQRTTIQYFD